MHARQVSLLRGISTLEGKKKYTYIYKKIKKKIEDKRKVRVPSGEKRPEVFSSLFLLDVSDLNNGSNE